MSFMFIQVIIFIVLVAILSGTYKKTGKYGNYMLLAVLVASLFFLFIVRDRESNQLALTLIMFMIIVISSIVGQLIKTKKKT